MEQVAIIGGGMGGLSAAYGLIKSGGVQASDITVFQMGWRLGGKCATGRGPHERIEEHGIHGFLGCYYNTLLMMKDVYDDISQDMGGPIDSFEKAFVHIDTGLHWERDGGALKRWPKWTPTSKLTFTQIKQAAPQLLLTWLKVYAFVLGKKLKGVPSDAETFSFAKSARWGSIIGSLEGVEQAVSDWIDRNTSDHPSLLNKGDDDFWRGINPFIDRIIKHSTNNGDAVRRNLLEIEMFQVILRGIRDDNIFTNGFRAIDDINFPDWLSKHGATGNLLESPLIAYVANLTFQFPRGDISLGPEMSAASYIQWALRSGTFVGTSLWLFAAGTGETVITPLYLYLKKKGVTFKFFHELTDIETTDTGQTVTALKFQEQAKIKSGGDYAPLHEVKGLQCWSSQADYAQLVPVNGLEGADLERPGDAAFGDEVRFDVGSDKACPFAKVILAIPPAAICAGAPELIKTNAHWKERIPAMPTTATQAMQIWFKRPIATLAGMPPLIENGEIRSFYYGSANFPGEMHGELDFTKYIRFEDWGEGGPQGLLYGCGVMVDPPDQPGLSPRQIANLRAYETSRTMLTVLGADLLPLSVDQTEETVNSHALDFDDVYVHANSPNAGAVGQNRLLDHYFRGNVYPSDRYTQSPPSTRSMRINPLQPHCSNLTGAGDWVDTVLNVGSVECSVMGGLLAAAFTANPAAAESIIGSWVTPADSLMVS